MPICIEVERDKNLFHTICRGTITIEDFMTLHQTEGQDKSLFGLNELFDATQADFSGLTHQGLLTIAQNTAKLPAVDTSTRIAMLVSDTNAAVLGELYRSIEDLLPDQSREFKIFYDHDEAMEWLEQTES